MDTTNTLKPGTKLLHYRIESVLGIGGFGITYKAFDENLHGYVAIKEYLPQSIAMRATDALSVTAQSQHTHTYRHSLKAFIEEARNLYKLNHPNIVGVLSAFELNGTAYFVMPFEEGESMDVTLKRMPDGGVTEQDILAVIIPILNGLKAVHAAGILHRDVKPGNIFIRDHGEPMLIDFGASRQDVGEQSKSMTAIVSMGYAPPEQYSPDGKYQGPWSDLYAIGAIIYRMVTGSVPMDSSERQTGFVHSSHDPFPPLSHHPKVSGYSEALISSADWCMQLNGANRPQSVDQLLTVLDEPGKQTTIVKPTKASVSKQTKAAPNPTAPPLPSPSTPSSSLMKVILSALLVVVLAGGGYFAYEAYQKHQEQQRQAELTKQADHSEWEQAQSLNTIASYEQYLEDWPSGIYKNDANKVLAALNEQTKRIKLVQQKLRQLNYQVVASGKLDVRTQKAIEAFEQAQGLLVTGAVDKLLIDNLDNATAAADKQAYERAQQVNSITAYSQYLSDNPNGNYRTQAKAEIDKLKVAQRIANAKAEAKRQDDNAWKVASDTHTIAAYQAYRNNQPQGQYRNEAQQLIDAIELENSKVPLTINVTPSDAKIEILNIKQRYTPGIRLLPNQAYQIRLSKIGFKTKTDVITLTQAQRLSISLERDIPEVIQDLIDGLVNIPGGSFMMGSDDGGSNENPVHRVSVPAFKLMEHEVTWAMYQPCIDAGACPAARDSGWGKGNRPVINVSWNDITEKYIPWLSQQTGQTFRLPTEAEWEYAARAGSTTKYSWGNTINCSQARYGRHPSGGECSNSSDGTVSVKSFKPNQWGLYDMHGNVFEWTQDCWNGSYSGAPTDGSAWLSGICTSRVLRGGSWYDVPNSLRSAYRNRGSRSNRYFNVGFRLAQDK